MIRRTASLLALVSFLAIVLSSVVLYMLPGGKGLPGGSAVFFGMTKGLWKDLHITGGFLFLIAAFWHIALNFGAITNYLKGSLRVDRKAALPALLALTLTVFVYAGTLLRVEPMLSILTAMKPPVTSQSASR